MSIKVPIRTVYDAANNAIGLSEFQSGELVGYAHGGTGLGALGSAGQVLQVNSGADGLEWGNKTSVNLNPYITVSNANINYVTKSTAVTTNNAIINLINDRMQVANVQSLVTTQINTVLDGAPGALDTLNELAAAIGDDANFATTITTSLATKASNTYVNAQIGASNTSIRLYVDAEIGASNTNIRNYIDAEIGSSNTNIRNYIDAEIGSSNTNIRSYTDATYETKAVALASNNALIGLINDRLQVANAAALYQTIAIERAALANTNSRLNVLEAGGTLATNTYIVANYLQKTSSSVQNTAGELRINSTNATTGTHVKDGSVTIFANSGTPAYIDFYCEGGNTHRARVKSAAHLDYSGNIDLTLPTTSGVIATQEYAAANSYVNAQIGASNTNIRLYVDAEIGASNTNIRNYTDTTYETKAVALSSNNAQNSLILDRLQVSNAASLFVNVSGDTMAGALAMGTNKITGLGDPTAAQDAATKTYVDTQVAGVVDSAPETLNTLNELAAALGDDANFATTTATSLGTKAANTYVNATFATKAYAAANTYVAAAATQMTAGNGLTGGGTLASNRTFNIGQGTGITVAENAISTNDSAIVHDNLSGFVANEHIDHSTVSITAGSGLTGGGTIAASRTLNIGQGTGITVAADAISTNDGQIVHDNLSGFVANEHIDHSSVTFTAGTGLTGGGTIAASRTFNVDVGTTANKIVQLDGSARLPAVDGSQLTGLNAGATVTDKSDNVNYNIVFTNETSGIQALAGIDNTALTYNPSTGTLNAGDFVSSSDINLKENIKTIDDPIGKVDSLRGVNFNWKENGEYAMGVIAQEIEQIIPEVVSEANGVKGVNYGAVIGLLIEAIKEQKQQIDELRNIINNV